MESNREQSVPAKALLLTRNVLCFIWVLIHFYYILYLPFSPDLLNIIHIGMGSLTTSLTFMHRSLVNGRVANFLILGCFAAIFVASTIFFVTHYEILLENVGQSEQRDVIFGALLVAALLGLCVQAWGWIIPLVITASMVYGLLGNHLGGILFHAGLEFDRLIGYSCTFFSGIFGSLTTMSATLIIHFMLFGALLQACGAMEFIEKISYIIGVRFRSGAAQTAIYSSAFMGMISGSTAANVAVTGAFTIPLMKKNGYAPEFAGAVEATASTGGQIMPPIMGITAFLISSMIGVPYTKIAIAAFLPAVIYFCYLSISVVIETRRMNLYPKPRPEDMPPYTFRDVLRQHGAVVLVPIVLLTWRMLIGEPPTRAVLWADSAVLGIAFVEQLYKGRDHIGATVIAFVKKVVLSLIKGADEAAKLAVIIAGMGIIIEMFTTTGFGQRLSYSIVHIAGSSMFLLVLLVGALTIFFGMGMPTPGAYLLAVLLSAPALTALGFETLSVHFFVFYFAIMSSVTPPVAIAVVVATGIADCNYLGCARRALVLALPGFLMPLYFLYVPEVLKLQTAPLLAIAYNAALFIALIGVTVAWFGYFLRPVGLISRVVMALSACAVFLPEDISTIIGTVIIAVMLIYNLFFTKEKENV